MATKKKIGIFVANAWVFMNFVPKINIFYFVQKKCHHLSTTHKNQSPFLLFGKISGQFKKKIANKCSMYIKLLNAYFYLKNLKEK
jgi:hypothetical protein